VFLPMFFLSGVARYLFVPLAEAVVFAMLASYFLSRTLVPTLALYLLKAKDHHAATVSRNPFIRFQDWFERGFERLRHGYQRLLTTLVHRRFIFVPVFLLLCLCAWALVPWLGEDFFPDTDSGQFILHMRAKTGTRIEETARLADLIENAIRRVIPAQEVESMLDNVGLPYSTINFMHSTSGLIGAADADILVSLEEKHGPTADGGGFTQRDAATSLLVSLSGSFQTTPTFFLNWQNGVNYNLATQTPQYRIQSLQDLQNMPITSASMRRPEILADVASIMRSN